MTKYFSCLLALSLVGTVGFRGQASDRVTKPAYTYVIVHGATGGGWDWRTVGGLLEKDGHTVYRPTLTGLGERMHLANGDVNLTTHVNDIVNVILFEDLHDVVLVGHSYGGMVITGVMDRIPERLAHVIFLDAAAPADGQSALDVWGPLEPGHKVVNGLVNFSWLDGSKPLPRDVPQSLKTFTEPVSYRNPAAFKLPVTYVLFHEGSLAERVAADPSWARVKARGWTTRDLASNHVAERSHPRELAALLEAAVADRNASSAK
ncbi:MAG TPA: alpha/beta fold hydrolase [Lacunisphaera sp.]|nr:alpha/beta fold hydrolase [Lacunisphaera sp.]